MSIEKTCVMCGKETPHWTMRTGVPGASPVVFMCLQCSKEYTKRTLATTGVKWVCPTCGAEKQGNGEK